MIKKILIVLVLIFVGITLDILIYNIPNTNVELCHSEAAIDGIPYCFEEQGDEIHCPDGSDDTWRCYLDATNYDK